MKYVEKGAWPETKRFFSVMRCNHCTDAPCVAICPTTALHKRTDGIVDFDTSRCIGCKSCMQACPYDSLYIDPNEHTAQKCNYCVHRVEVGLEPACVVVCPEHAIVAGDLDSPTTEIAGLVRTRVTTVRAPEQGTGPNLFYLGADGANIDPLAATSLHDGGIWREPASEGSFMAVDLTPGSNGHRHTGMASSDHAAAPPRVVYNTDHPAPWGWRVSAYFLTKGIAAGLVIAVAMAMLFGASLTNNWMRWTTPLVAGLFLALTGVLLVWDLKRPDRFHYLIIKGNPGSWLVRGAYILSAYAAVLAVWFLAGVFKVDGLVEIMAWIGLPLGIATAGYTAFLFGQAEARDLWQSPVLLYHMIAGAFAAGGGVALIASLFFDVGETAERAFGWTLVIGSSVLGLFALAELATPHPTRNIEAAMHHMTRGHFAREWWVGGQLIGVVVPVALGAIMLAGGATWIGAVGGVAAAAGIWFADDAFVKAGQSVPLS